MIPADAPPSFDGHRETTYATVHAAAPFYSVLIRVPPDNPASTTEFVCDLCTEMPKPTDDGKTYTFKIRQGVKFHDGTPAHRRRTWRQAGSASSSRPRACRSARGSYYEMVDTVEAPDDDDRGVQAEVRHHGVPAGARRSLQPGSTRRRSSRRIRTGTRRTSWAPARSSSSTYEVGQSIKGERNPDYYHKGQPYLDGFVGIFADKQSVRVDAHPRRPRRDRVPRPAAVGARPAGQGAGRQDHGAGQRLELRQHADAQPQEEAVRRRARAPRAGAGDRPVEGRAGAGQDRQRPHGGRHRLPGLAAGGDQGGAAEDRGLLARHREVARRGAASC